MALEGNYSVFYTFTNDSTEYRATVKASSDDEADRRFRSGLRDEELWDVTVTKITRDANTTELNG